ncbi:MAG: tyrosine--tRNA ligase, partial [Myxococcota bacterium]
QTYKDQVFRVLDPARTEVRCNSEWLGALGLEQILKLCAMCSLARLIERDDFAARLAAQKSLAVHELLYPLMQAYDSVVLRADVELGGTDQLFNLLMGRHLMRRMGQQPQCVLTVPLLEGLDAREQDGKLVGQKMSKSLGNAVGVTEDPREQFGKLLSMADALMWRYFALLSSRSAREIEQLRAQHPKQAKEALALELVGRLHSPQEAQAAKEHFDALFGSGKRGLIPQDAPPVRLAIPPDAAAGGMPLFHVLHQADLVPSRAEAKRLVRQHAVTVDGDTVDEPNHNLKAGRYHIRVGKTRWARVELGESP